MKTALKYDLSSVFQIRHCRIAHRFAAGVLRRLNEVLQCASNILDRIDDENLKSDVVKETLVLCSSILGFSKANTLHAGAHAQ